MFKRQLTIPVEEHNAFFLWGPRKVGKSSFLRYTYPQAKYYDLLDTALQTELLIAPHRLREEVIAEQPQIIIVDEIQKVPKLLDEIHWCLENTSSRFILCGSSALKLKRGAANLLGGRAWRYEMFALTFAEVDDFDLVRAVNHGLLPQHYLSSKPQRFLHGYILDYLHEEIQGEANLRHLERFNQFLSVCASHHGQLLNYANVARQCGVSAKTVRHYYQILQDTLLGYELIPWKRKSKKRLIETAKFYLFDSGVVFALQGITNVQPGTSEFGWAFEHFIINELRAYLSYREKHLPLYFWRTSTNLEVDLIVGDLDLCVEIKAKARVRKQDLTGLYALKHDQPVKQSLVVSMDESKRMLEDNVLVIPWKDFLTELWAGKWI